MTLAAVKNITPTPSHSIANPKLSVRGVSKRFTTPTGLLVDALCDIDLEIRPEEFVCIIGPSGCGKSTLLNLMAGLEQPTHGEIYRDGHLVKGPGPDRLVVFQEGALFPWLTVLQNVEFGLKIQGIPSEQRRKRALDAIQMVRLTKFISAYPHQLSGGMKQRTAIARGLVMEPELLLMDEPFSALDAQTRDLLHEELQAIWQETRKTILFVTHNVREAACLADRIVLLSAHPGRIHRIYDVNIPRPRMLENPLVTDLARTVLADLKPAVIAAQSGELRENG